MQLFITPTTIAAALLFGAISAYLAHRREKNPYKWFFIGFLFGVFGVFALFFLPQKKRAPASGLPVPPLLVIKGPIDKLWYYLDPSQQQQGPMSHHALTGAFREGKISLSTYVWNEDMTDWKTLKELVAQKSAKS